MDLTALNANSLAMHCASGLIRLAELSVDPCATDSDAESTRFFSAADERNFISASLIVILVNQVESKAFSWNWRKWV